MKYRLVTFLTVFICAVSGAYAASMPRYENIFVIIAENKNSEHIIGGPYAPRLKAFAKEYGLATKFYGEVHPSEANYLAMLGGSTFGIHDDDAWYCEPLKNDSYCPHSGKPDYVTHSIVARSLMDQLDEARLTWKGYFEDLPAPGSLAIYDPSIEHPDPNRPRELYASKHNGFVSFERVRLDPDIAKKIVPLPQLRADLTADAMPNYAHIVLNQCNEMHGLPNNMVPQPPADCAVERGKPESFIPVIQRGDAAIGAIIDEIMAAPVWTKPGNVAIVVTWDEDSFQSQGEQGCCGSDPASAANFGGGHIATIVITNHGPRNLQDPEPYNHYSLLRTAEEAFGIQEYLGLAGSTEKGVKAMTPLFATAQGTLDTASIPAR